MSYSFYLPTGTSPNFHKTIDALPYDDVECDDVEYYPALGDPFPDDTFYHFYRWEISTRAVEVGWTGDALQVRIMTSSCREDYQLALDLVGIVAAEYGCEVEGEDRDPIDWKDYEHEYDGWLEHMIESGATFLPAMIKSGDYSAPLTLPGPRRDFHIGERVLSELGDPKDPEFADRLFEKIRSVRYVDPEDYYYHANIMQLENEETGNVVSLAVWGPGVDYLFPNVAYLSLIADELIHIPVDAAKELTDVTYIDECQMLVHAIDDDEWEDFLTRAKAYAVSLDDDEILESQDDSNNDVATNGVATNGDVSHKWWQFWK